MRIASSSLLSGCCSAVILDIIEATDEGGRLRLGACFARIIATRSFSGGASDGGRGRGTAPIGGFRSSF